MYSIAKVKFAYQVSHKRYEAKILDSEWDASTVV